MSALEAYPDWHDQAECLGVNPELFFPERGESTANAKTVCYRCTVRDDCLNEAIDRSEKNGIWGGLSERQRRRLRRERGERLAHGTDTVAAAHCGCELCLGAVDAGERSG